MNPNPTPSPITATKTPPRPRTMRTPVHPNHKRAHTHAAPNHTMPAGRRHLGWWIGGVWRRECRRWSTRRLLVVGDFEHKHLYPGSKMRRRC